MSPVFRFLASGAAAAGLAAAGGPASGRLVVLATYGEETRDTTMPAALRNFTATAVGALNIDLAWTLNGHGAAGLPPTGIDNAATAVDNGAVDQVPPVRCETCHDELAGHIGAAKTAINGTNPWRLDNALTRYAQVGGLGSYCLGQCHSQTAKPPRHARIVTGAFAQAKDNSLHTHPAATAVVGTGLAAWCQVPAADIPLADDLASKTPPARTNASLVACVSCHDPHGVGTALVPGRSFSGVNTPSAPTRSSCTPDRT